MAPRTPSRAEIRLGANYLGDRRCRFLVWAPSAQQVEVHILAPGERFHSLNSAGWGYFEIILDDVEPGTLYMFRLDGGEEFPDAASRFQPRGVLGPSQVTNPDFTWDDGLWPGISLQKYILYELHVGTFTQDGTFEAIIHYLDELKQLGVNAIELMPVAQFPGNRNWGYDGAYPFAVQNSYGGPQGLKHLVNACHKKGLAVVLDVVYNHLGPEGSYLSKYGPYFTERHKTDWGKAVNFDGPGSDEVRRFFIENALYWITEFHIDALRLDAVHAILDYSPFTFLEELALTVKEQAENLNRRIYLIAESDANDSRLIRSPDLGGYGLDAQWNDDFHHALRVLLTGEQRGYYQDFNHVRYLVTAFREGYAYSGEHSRYRGFRRGSSSRDIPSYRFVVYSQNHDQIGNRMLGERLGHLVSFEGLKLAAGAVLLSPCIPLLFMGQEYGETAYFPYFVSHSDPELVKAVREGRKREFAAFHQTGEPPDPQSEETFQSARLHHDLRHKGQHQVLYRLYQDLICLRKEIPALNHLDKESLEATGYEKYNLVFIRRASGDSEIIAGFNFGDVTAPVTFPVPGGHWRKRVDSAEKQWQGNGSVIPDKVDSDGEMKLDISAKSFVLFSRE